MGELLDWKGRSEGLLVLVKLKSELSESKRVKLFNERGQKSILV